jgi:hypothetical protein
MNFQFFVKYYSIHTLKQHSIHGDEIGMLELRFCIYHYYNYHKSGS